MSDVRHVPLFTLLTKGPKLPFSFCLQLYSVQTLEVTSSNLHFPDEKIEAQIRGETRAWCFSPMFELFYRQILLIHKTIVKILVQLFF